MITLQQGMVTLLFNGILIRLIRTNNGGTVTGTGAYIISHRNGGMTIAYTGDDIDGAHISQLPTSSQAWKLVPTNVKAPKEAKQKPSKFDWGK